MRKTVDVNGANMDLRKPPHPLRSTLLALAVLAAGAGIWGYSRHMTHSDQARLGPYDAFRATYADKCDAPSYAAPAPKVIRDDYLKSPPIRTEVSRQLAALNDGASCQQVSNKLRAVDFAVPAPGSG